MHYYRVSKYSQNAGFDPTLPATNEWTSIADVGNVFNGIEFTMQEYVRMEEEYIGFVADVMKKSNIKAVKLAYIEARGKRIWRKNKELDILLTCQFVQDCLREYCWGQIIAENFIWEAGYDFYMHIGTKFNIYEMQKIAEKRHLFVDNWGKIEIVPVG